MVLDRPWRQLKPAAIFVLFVTVTFGAGCAPAPEFRPTAMTAQQLLIGHLPATGARFAPAAYHLRYKTVASDGDVETSDVYRGPGPLRTADFRLVIVRDGVRVERGRFAGRSWLRGENGLVLPDSAPPTVFDRLVSNARRGPDPRVRLLGITTAVPPRYVLDIRPNPRIEQLRYFDIKTLLLMRQVTRDYDQSVEDVTYSGFVSVGGAPVASLTVRTTSVSNKTYRTVLLQRRRIAYQRALLAVPRSHIPFVPQHHLPMTLNTTFGDSGILVRADIGGSAYWLKLDSGASGVFLDRNVVNYLGLREFSRGMAAKGGPIPYSSAILPRIDIGPLFAKNLVVHVISTHRHEQRLDVVGLLGCDFIGSRPIAIDFQREVVSVMASPPASTDGRWIRVDSPLQSCLPYVDARFQGRGALMALDLGADDTVVNEDAFARFGSDLSQIDTKPITFMGGKRIGGNQYVVPSVAIGALELGPTVVTVPEGAIGQNLNDDGILGRNALRGYGMVLDYAHERTYFQRSESPGD